MNTDVNENEVSTVESSAPQTNMENTEVTSVSSTNNYILDTEKKQVSSNNSSKQSPPSFYNFKTQSFMHTA